MSNDSTAADYEDYGPWIFGPTKLSDIFNNQDPVKTRPPNIVVPEDLGCGKSHHVATTDPHDRDLADPERSNR